ncbi:NTPase KAP family P-loop domain-containing protein 1-like [Crotalus adamanteus]|uniref:NTPase KAP family P-loop domain-containing protein 1-like n=1 Tax=Crotalus adamanteus TaxID=8729 RepID=A0AAW1AXD1_CROAD
MSYYDEEVARLHHAECLCSSRETGFSHAECHDEDLLTEDDIYCCSLSKTLCHTSTPVTVGFYSPCGTRIHSLLDQIAGCMLKESIRREEEEYRRTHQRSRVPEGINYLTLLWYIVFYQPVITEVHLRRKTIEFLFIRFSAWEYAGSDKLWAGLVTTLCDHIRHQFGPLPLSFYQVVGSRPQFASGFTQTEWRLKRKTCCAAGGLVVVLLAGAGLATTALLVPGIRDGTTLKVLGSTIAAISGSGFIIAISPVIKHLILSQKKKIESMTSDEKFTSHLGFMSAVKREIEVLTSFVYYMEIFERRRLRIVFEITCLDMCYPERVVGVLNAINTLLSDRNAPFIFILVVDPCVIVSCLEQASTMKGMADNGYLYLNRTVTLPFSIPEIGIKSKMRCLHEAFQTREDLMYGIITRNVELGVTKSKGNVEALVNMEAEVQEDQQQIDALAVQYIHEAFHCLHNEQDCLYHYVPDSIIQMRRIVNTIPITIRLMTQQHLLRHNICARAVASWVVLADQWPCRLSWILQCMEDKLQCQPPNNYEKELMWDVFVETCPELYSKHKELKNIMALDGDPELFEKFLSGDFPFTVQEGKKLLKYTAPACLGRPVDGPATPELMSYSDEEAAQLPHAEEYHEAGSLFSRKDSHFSHDGRCDEDHQSGEDVYFYSLKKILCQTPTPVTVGFCSSYKIRLHALLDKIKESIFEESIKKEEKEFSRTRERSRVPKGINYLILLWYIIFYQPVITEKHHKRKNFNFLFIQFSAWEYACSNQLWAGLIATLCDNIRKHFGPLPLSLYQVVGSNPELDLQATQKEWRHKKKTCCMAVGLLLIVLLTVIDLATVVFFVPGIRDGTFLKYLGSSIAAILGSGFIITISPVIKNLIISQKKKIESMTSNEKFTKHLGFRSAMKREIEVLTNFIHYMEIFECRPLKIVFEITSLDICYPEQVVGVLNAIHTLLSNKDSPFIFILVVDPCIIVSCLEQASSMKGMADNGYLYLNRIMTLPFSIPEIAIESKRQSLQKTLESLEVLITTRNLEVSKDLESQKQIDALASQYIREAFQCLQDEKDCLYRYVPDNIVQMWRIGNAIILMIRLMTQQHPLRNKRCAQNVASWVVLANQWPCRLSWILQCVEDKLQCIEDKLHSHYEKKLMWDVFVEICPELLSNQKELKNIMALDDDPELFERFLSADFRFTVQEGHKYLKYTVNLDHSLKFKMGQLRALGTLEKNYSKDGANSEKRA